MFGNTVASIMSSFTRTIDKLETLAESELVNSNDLAVKSNALADASEQALLESTKASGVAAKLRVLVG